MAANLESYEARGAALADTLLAIQAQIDRYSVQTWSSANGAGYEQVYNDGVLGPDGKPTLNGTQAQLTQSQMNNLISALNSISAAIQKASAALSTAAEYSPTVTS